MPLVVSVMGFSRDELADARGGGGRARRGGDDRAERVLPERRDRPRHGRRPGRDGPGGRAGAPARPTKPLIVKLTPNATDPAAVAARRRGGRRRRGLADQHAQGHGARPATTGEPWLGGAHRRASRGRRCARSRWSRSARWPSASQIPVIGMGGIAIGPPRGRFPGRRAPLRRRRHRELPRPGRRAPDRAPSSPSCPSRQRSIATGSTTRLSPFGGHERAVSPEDAGTFAPLRADSANLLTKSPANEWENAQGPPTSLKLRSRSS